MLSLFSSGRQLKTHNRAFYSSLLVVFQTQKSSHLKSLKFIRKGYTLNAQINSNACSRYHLSDKKHNFNATLPKHLAEQAYQSMKDLCMFDMLGNTKPVIETEIEHLASSLPHYFCFGPSLRF